MLHYLKKYIHIFFVNIFNPVNKVPTLSYFAKSFELLPERYFLYPL